MKKTLVKWSCLAIGVLASCQQRDLSEGISSDSLALNLQASVAGEIISRTTTQQDGHTTFVQGDKIGFFMPEGDDAYFGWDNWVKVVVAAWIDCLVWPDRRIII